MPNITLCCIFQGEKPGSIFKVEIEYNESVSNLKKLIEKEKPNVNIVKLWKVDIPLEEDNNFNIIEGEKLDTTKKVAEYFSDEPSDRHVHIIVQREQINVALFGRTGHGKSSIANMLVQSDIYRGWRNY